MVSHSTQRCREDQPPHLIGCKWKRLIELIEEGAGHVVSRETGRGVEVISCYEAGTMVSGCTGNRSDHGIRKLSH